MTAFNQWWDFCMRPDNDGQGLHNTPGDSGGWTAWGITRAVYEANAKKYGLPPGFAGLRLLTQAGSATLAKPLYWDRIQADQMPGPAAILWADFDWTSGGATGDLQRMLGVSADGMVGPHTLKALKDAYNADPIKTLQRMTGSRIAYDTGLNDPEFIKGWTRRANDCLVVAKATQGTPTA